MSRLTPDQVLATPAGELAALQGDELFQLKNDAANLPKRIEWPDLRTALAATLQY